MVIVLHWEELANQELIIHTPAADTQQAIEALTGLLYERGYITDLTAFRRAVYEREAELATELTPTVLVPHAKSDTVLTSAIAAMPTVDKRTVFLLASRNDREHIEALSRLSAKLLEEAQD